MSTYWKQSLVIGGIYWLFSLILEGVGSWTFLMIDLGLAFLLLLFLIPMNKLVPIKWVDKLIGRHPVVSTMLASVGWLPYFTAMLVIISSIAAIALQVDSNNDNMVMLLNIVVKAVVARKFAAVLVVAVVLVMVLVYGKSIAGQLDDHYNVAGKQKVAAEKEKFAAVVEVKKTPMIEKKEVEKKVQPKAETTKKPVAKKAPIKKAKNTKAAATKTGKKAQAEKAVKKTPVKKVAKKAPVKKKAVK